MISKKILLATSIVVSMATINSWAEQGQPVIVLDQHSNQNLIGNSTFLATIGGLCFIKGLLDYYDIPVTWQDSLVMTLRQKLSDDDFKKLKLGNKIKTYAEVLGGAFLFVVGSLGVVLAAAQQPVVTTAQ